MNIYSCSDLIVIIPVSYYNRTGVLAEYVI